jgi:hypothetical protein
MDKIHLKINFYLIPITCQSYDKQSDSYHLRHIVRVVLVDVK